MTAADSMINAAPCTPSDPAQLIREVSVSTQVMQRITDGMLSLVPRSTFAAILRPDGEELMVVAATGGDPGTVGHRQAVDGTLAGLALRRGEMLVSDDSVADPRVAPAIRAHPDAGSVVAMPLSDRGTEIGVLVVIAKGPAAFGPCAQARLRTVRDFITSGLRAVLDLSAQVQAALADPGGCRQLDADDLREVSAFLTDVVEPGQSQRSAQRRRVADVVSDGALDIVVQPIVDLASGRTRWVEALSRFPVQPLRGPDRWFAEAERVGLGLELEELALTRALAQLARLDPGIGLAVNIGPEMLVSPRLLALLADAATDRLSVELTEHERCEDYPRAQRAIAELRRGGVHVCIDDVGAGFSSFRHVVELAPDVIKLDRYFTAGIEEDPARWAMAEALVGFAASMGIALVAEGIETARQLRAIGALGVGWGQGYLIARPGPVADVAARYAQIVGALRPAAPAAR